MKLNIIVSIFVFFILVVGCDKNETPTSSIDISGEYQYKGYDLQNNIVSSGILEIVINGKEISGTKILSGDDGENGEGEISGYIEDNGNITIYLNLNSVSQIVLKGVNSDGSLTGDRLSDRGPVFIKQGTFKAFKIQL